MPYFQGPKHCRAMIINNFEQISKPKAAVSKDKNLLIFVVQKHDGICKNGFSCT